MTAQRGLAVRQTGTSPSAVGTTPTQARLALAGLVFENAPGVPRTGLMGQSNFNVVTGTANMSYDVGPCNPVINRATNEGVYVFSFTGTTNIPTTAAPGSGSRWDLIYVKQNDPDKGDADNLAIVGVVQGTSSTGTPTKPYSDPAVVAGSGALVIAEAQVFTGATATNGGSVVITAVFPYTAARRAVCPIKSDTDRATLTSPTIGTLITRRDRAGSLEIWTGTEWDGIDQYAQGQIAEQVTTASSVGLSGGETMCDLEPITTRTGRLYKIHYRVDGIVPTAASVGIQIVLRKSVTSDATATGANIAPGEIHWSAPVADNSFTMHAFATYRATADETINIKAIMNRATGSALFNISNRYLTIVDEGFQY